MKLLTLEIAPLVVALRGGYFQRAGVRLATRTSPLELVAELRAHGADVVVLDVAAARAADVLAAVRAARATTTLLLALDRDGALADDLVAFDGVVAIAAPAESLLRTLGDRLPPPRSVARLAGRVSVQIFAPGRRTRAAETLDVSPRGAGVRVAAPVDAGASLLFQRDDGRSALVRAELIWCRRVADVWRAGFRFVGAGDLLPVLRDLALWDTVVIDGERVLRLHGELAPQVALDGLAAAVPHVGVVDLADVVALADSTATRLSTLLRATAASRRLRLRGVPGALSRLLVGEPAIVVESYAQSFACARCRLELVDIRRPGAAAASCPLCAAPLRDAAVRDERSRWDA